MKKTLLLAGIACLFSTSSFAAEFAPYVSGKMIYSYSGIDTTDSWSNGSNPGSDKFNFDKGVWGVSVAGGVSTKVAGGAIRTELELNVKQDAKKTNGSDKLKMKNDSLMMNAYYDIDTNTAFTPYVGGGIGYARLKGSVDSRFGELSKSSDEFAWQLGAGVAYALNDNVSLDLGYRYSDFGSVEKEYLPDRNYKADVDAHEFLFGARYTF